MQLAWMTWMQAAMQADYTGHEALQAYTGHDSPQEFEFEDDEYAHEDEDYGFQEIDIDIAAELLHIADEGLAVVANAVHLADCLLLRVQLGDISDTFADIKTTPADYHQHYRGDYLELRAANALKQVDELLRQQTALEAPPLPPAAIAELKVLQRHAQDVAVLLCGRFIDQRILRTRRIPAEMLHRLNTSFTATSLADVTLRSRLGNSKTKVFQPGVSYGPGKRTRGDRRTAKKHNQRNRAEAADLDDHASPTEARNPAASSSAASPSAAAMVLVAAAASSSSTRLSAPPGPAMILVAPRFVVPTQKELHEIDIAAEIVRVASEGLAVIDVLRQARRQSNSFSADAADLASVKETFLVLRCTPAYCHSHSVPPRCDDLERRVAAALLQVEELLRRHAPVQKKQLRLGLLQQQHVHDLRLLQTHVHDLAVLACCRFMPQTILQTKGIPSDLRTRLDTAFKEAIPLILEYGIVGHPPDHSVLSRLGHRHRSIFIEKLLL